MVADHSVQIAIDRGGTFTDCFCSWPTEDGKGRREHIIKLLSRDPGNYEDAPREGVRRLLEIVLDRKIPRSEKLDTSKVAWLRLSTTVGTNALLERQGSRHALLITKGFGDLLQIGNQTRPKIFDLNIRRPQQLYDHVVEIDERVSLVGYAYDAKAAERAVQFDETGKVKRHYDGVEMDNVVQGMSGEAVHILKAPDSELVRQQLQSVYDNGIRTLAIVFMHSYTFADHEKLVGKIAHEMGFTHVSLSCEAMPMIKVVPRGMSCTADAYLTPVLQSYIDGFFGGFDESLRRGVEDRNADAKRTTTVEFMNSDGGLSDVKTFSGLKSILSGPAGGVVGAALTSWDEKQRQPLVMLDMGGTSTDVSRFDGRYETVFETVTAGIAIQSPQLDINTVAAGGGSRLFWRNGMFAVGPESAGAHPGPACYRKGGPLAVTDANLVLGRLIPKYFPSIFGEDESQPLDPQASQKAFKELQKTVNDGSGKDLSLEQVAAGFIRVANESMCRPIRSLTEMKGYSTAKHILVCFGGAGGQHACSLAAALGIRRILIHRYSSCLSAYGLSLADRVLERQEPSSATLSDETISSLTSRLAKLAEAVMQGLEEQGFEKSRIKIEHYLNLRYNGTDSALMIQQEQETDRSGWQKAFEDEYRQQFGFSLKAREVIVDDIRVRGVGKSFDTLGKSVFEEESETTFETVQSSDAAETSESYFDDHGKVSTPIYLLGKLRPGQSVEGPALIIDDTQTLVIEPKTIAKILQRHVIIDL
ncbi:uncharacterized protein L969DRAFT_90657 [Mixia osmundae IAM 14324]|uniref:5-oxoprolinase n=1 Tax=Mixia osmundae (strain CBS 9802 / IAM 14324 / JCM 22182 / KY 12970) TaxID=764103 RepID=G7E1L7_MIXOS|nr:uncharacterized protein L969DRAFT_90657 [Mixia osmundae IAM 14324]KEI36678.1 hypothetical protein L969DRAFT_90657 [Mixia osmundae IAM 14324]GAA96727.1 hypothetical protein E5Q_03398 [Mixia osmundae IAM 14324]